MAKLGSEKRPVIIRVKSEEKARAILESCTARGWQCIAGVEADEPEDISDFERLMNLGSPARSAGGIGRNQQCPCGSGRKYKRCCAVRGATAEQAAATSDANIPAQRFRYESGSYGGRGCFMPSIMCFERNGVDSW